MLTTALYPAAREPQPERVLYVREDDEFEEASVEDIIASAHTLIFERIRPRRRLLSPPERTRKSKCSEWPDRGEVDMNALVPIIGRDPGRGF